MNSASATRSLCKIVQSTELFGPQNPKFQGKVLSRPIPISDAEGRSENRFRIGDNLGVTAGEFEIERLPRRYAMCAP